MSYVSAMYVNVFNDKYPCRILNYEYIALDHNGAWSVLLMGAISMVKEHNTNRYCQMLLFMLLKATF